VSRLVVLSVLLAAVVAVGSGLPAPPQSAATDYYLKIEGIDGESEDGAIAVAGLAWDTQADVGRFSEYTAPHEAAEIIFQGRSGREASSGMASGIAVSDSGVQSPGPKTTREVRPPREAASGMASGREAASGMATGRRMHKPMTIVKEWDAASAKLMQACVDGTHIGNVEVWSREGGQATLRYTLQDAIISGYSLSRLTGSDGGVGELTESISFSFAEVDVTPPVPAEATNLNSSRSN